MLLVAPRHNTRESEKLIQRLFNYCVGVKLTALTRDCRGDRFEIGQTSDVLGRVTPLKRRTLGERLF